MSAEQVVPAPVLNAGETGLWLMLTANAGRPVISAPGETYDAAEMKGRRIWQSIREYRAAKPAFYGYLTAEILRAEPGRNAGAPARHTGGRDEGKHNAGDNDQLRDTLQNERYPVRSY